MARRFRVTCTRCGMVIFAAVDRIDEPELRVLREHLRVLHPADAVPDNAPAGDVLRHFTVEEVAR